MIDCPDCGYENLPGADECEQCQQSLSALSGALPGSVGERIIATDSIRLLAPKRPIVVAADTPVGAALATLVDRHVGCVLVEEQGAIVGIFTERDALLRLNTAAAELAGEPIARFMTPDPVTLETRDTIAFALHRMDVGGFRHIPVTTNGAVTGIISVRDILRYVTQRLVATV